MSQEDEAVPPCLPIPLTNSTSFPGFLAQVQPSPPLCFAKTLAFTLECRVPSLVCLKA